MIITKKEGSYAMEITIKPKLEDLIPPKYQIGYNVTVYSTDCPKCKILERKLTEKNIPFFKITGNIAVDTIKKAGYTEAPLLKLNDQFLPFGQAVKWVNISDPQ